MRQFVSILLAPIGAADDLPVVITIGTNLHLKLPAPIGATETSPIGIEGHILHHSAPAFAHTYLEMSLSHGAVLGAKDKMVKQLMVCAGHLYAHILSPLPGL